MNHEKLHKVLARYGLGSRRQMEYWIEQGRVKVNGEKATLGMRVSHTDRIDCDNRHLDRERLFGIASTQVLLYHKPVGEICSRHDDVGRVKVFDRLPVLKQGRWISVGRLDVNSCGLLLFTNDGGLAHRLMHPSSHIEREYAVRVLGAVTPTILEQLQRGVLLDDGPARFVRIRSMSPTHVQSANRWFRVVLEQGRYRLVRRLWESQGMKVNRLIRIRYGHCMLPKNLSPGSYQHLDPQMLM